MNKTNFHSLVSAIVLFGLLFFVGCNKEEPKKEDTPELITKATLTFTPVDGSGAVTVTATDPDNQGAQPIRVDGPINLAKNKTFLMTISLTNGLAQPTDPAYDISAEVEEEGDEHQFYFSWTNSVFSNPTGDGNIDNPIDPVNYTGGTNSKDTNGRNLGLTTTWTTANPTGTVSSSFRVLLKHQPGLKTNTSDANTGETDFDLTFVLNVQ